MNEKKINIGILGGGLAGLSLGYFISQKNIDFLILEKSEKIGGLLKSVNIDGFIFDVGGSHVIFSKDKEILKFLISLLRNNVVRNYRNARIFYKGNYIKYPFENGLGDLPSQENFECLYSFIKAFIRREKGEFKKPGNMKEWFYYMFGNAISEKYLLPYNEKIWKFPLDKISTFWVERIPQPPIEDVIKSSLGFQTEGYKHQLHFYYPKTGGIQALAESFEKFLDDKVILNFEIKKIKKEDEKWVVSNGRKEFEFDKLISTIPLQELTKALESVPKEVKGAVNNLKFNSLITVGIGIEKPMLNNFSWVYLPDKNILPHRISFPSNYSPLVAPTNNFSILAEITYREGDRISNMSEKEIVERTLEDLNKIKIINKKDVVLTTFHRFKYAYVIYDLEYFKNTETIFNYLCSLGIESVGRFGRWEYMNMDATIKMSKEFVKNKVKNWNISL